MSVGTYVALVPTPASVVALYDFCKDSGIEINWNPDNHSLHTTVIYSRKWVPAIQKSELTVYDCEVRHLDIFKGQDGKNVLVAVLRAPAVVIRHEQLRAIYELTHDFPDYIPHISLSYDFPKSIDELVYVDPPRKILLWNEYVEDLDLT